MVGRYGFRTRTASQVGQWILDDPDNGIPWYSLNPNVLASTGLATVTADATAHVKGAWSEIIASTAQDVSFLFVVASGVGATTVLTSTLVDIGVGGSGSEVAVASNMSIGGAIGTGVFISLPIFVPAGSRIAARIQSVVTGGKTASIRVDAYSVGNVTLVPKSVDVLGADTATSAGTAMSGASGTYVEIVASSSQKYAALGIVPAINSGTIASINVTYTVAVGSAGNEIDVGSILASYAATELVSSVGQESFVFPAKVPAGSRISLKHNIPGPAGGVNDPARYCAVVVGVPA